MGALLDLFNDLPSEAKRRLLLGWLPILLIIILLCVFGGLPPTSWGLMIRFLSLGNALNTVQSSVLSDSLNALFIQSLCTLIAWVLVILAIVFEVIAFRSMQMELRISRLQAKLALPAHKVQAAAASPAPALPARSVAPSGMDRAATPPQPKNYGGVRVVIDNTPDVYPSNPFVGKTADAKSAKSQGVQIPSHQQDQPDPFAAQEEVLDLFEKEDDSSSLPNEQFAIQEKIVEEPVFVFGNPFEGDLPDVFTYDKDLQKAVAGLRTVSASKPSPDVSKGAGTDRLDQDKSDEESK